MRILLKYPTRGRPLWFAKTLDLYLQRLSGKHDVRFLIAMDVDDPWMHQPLVTDYMNQVYPGRDDIEYFWGEHRGKVAAVNSGIQDRQWDIVLVISDDIEPVSQYDDIIATDFAREFPGGDGLLYYNDTRCGRTRITIPIMDRLFFERFGWTVHPDYFAWGDDYLTKLWKHTGCVKYIDSKVLVHHWKKYIPKNNKGKRKDATSVRAEHKKTRDYRVSAKLLADMESKIYD